MDDAARVGAEEVGHRLPVGDDDRVGPALGRGDDAAVGDGRGQRVGDGAADDVRHLAAAGAVEVGRPLDEGREVGTDPLDVVGHAVIFAHRRRRTVRALPADDRLSEGWARTAAVGHQEVCSGRPSAKPAVLWMPTVARSWNSSSERAPA